MANENLTDTLHLDTVDQLNRLLSEARSVFTIMGVADPAEMPAGTMRFASCTGERLLDQVMARIDATLR